MSAPRIALDLLIGRKVRDAAGRTVGHIEEIRVLRGARVWTVEEYHVGAYGLLERLSALPLGAALLGVRQRRRSYAIRWDEVDVSDPLHPRLLVDRGRLRRLDAPARRAA